MEDPAQSLGDVLEEIEGAHELTYIRFSLTGEIVAGEVEAVMDLLQEYSQGWPFHSLRRGGLTIIQDDTADEEDERLHMVERELHRIGLEEDVLTRATVLLRRMYRRLGQ